VCRTTGGELLTGRDALRAARTDPSGLEPHPKRCIDDGTVSLAGGEVPVGALITAVLRRVADEAVRAAGGELGGTTLTCPAGWGPRRRAILLAAARDAGLPRPELVAEPVAAAHAYGRLPEGGTLLVYDLGAGTFDASVVRRTADGFDVLAQIGLDDAGGLEIDAAIIAYLGAVFADRDPQRWRRLLEPATDADRRAARQLWDDARAAKESLSRNATTVIHVPLFDLDAPLGREQLDRLAAPILDRTVQQTRAVLREAAQAPEALDGVLLVGGASRLPLVATVLHRRLGVAPIGAERPELLVAEGSTLVPRDRLEGAGSRPTEPTPPPESVAPGPTGPEPVVARRRPPRAAHGRPDKSDKSNMSPVDTRKRPRRLPAALVTLLLACGFAVYADSHWWHGRVFGIGGCLAVNLVSSDEKAGTLRRIADRFRQSGRTVDGDCIDMKVSVASSRLVADALAKPGGWDPKLGARPDVWSPSSSVWTERLRAAGSGVLLRPDLPSMTRTPVVIGMPRPMAEALGWPAARIGWKDIAALAADPRGWGAKGHPEWGAFTIGRTNPNTSTTGLLSLASTAAALGFPADPAAEARIHAVELAAVHYGGSSSTFTRNLHQADAEGAGLFYVSAIALEEQVILQYNRGNLLDGGQQEPPRTPLVAIYPVDGTISSDNPYAVLGAPWVDGTKVRAGEAFLRFAREPAQAALFLEGGFRDAEDHAGDALRADANLRAEPSYTTVPPPDARTATALLALWGRVRKPASVLIVVDESGSMSQGAGDKTRLQLAKEAAAPAVDNLGPADEIALWAFSGPEAAGRQPWRELLPLTGTGAAAARYKQSVEALRPHGETALYATVRAAVEHMKAAQDDKRIYAVVVLSDGANEYATDNDLGRLLADLRRGSLEKPVRVFTIAYGGDADAAALDGIARAARGGSYDAKNAADIQFVFSDVLSNF